MFVCCECCVLSGRGLCDELISRPEESYRLWCVVYDLENLKNEEAMTSVGSQLHSKKKKSFNNKEREKVVRDNNCELNCDRIIKAITLETFTYCVSFPIYRCLPSSKHSRSINNVV
jgi:hypothetical protein